MFMPKVHPRCCLTSFFPFQVSFITFHHAINCELGGKKFKEIDFEEKTQEVKVIERKYDLNFRGNS